MIRPEGHDQIENARIAAGPKAGSDGGMRLDYVDVSIVFRIAGKSKGSATFWTCDLT